MHPSILIEAGVYAIKSSRQLHVAVLWRCLLVCSKATSPELVTRNLMIGPFFDDARAVRPPLHSLSLGIDARGAD